MYRTNFEFCFTPELDTILEGPFWQGPVRVLRAHSHDAALRIEAVGVVGSVYYDLFRLAVKALRTHMAHALVPRFAVSVPQVDPLASRLDPVDEQMLPRSRLRFLLADEPGAGKTIMTGLHMREMMQRGEVSRS